MISHFASLVRPWRLAAGISLAISLAVLGLVAVMAVQSGGLAEAKPLAQEPWTLTVTRGGGDCLPCVNQDPLYDPEMGYFNVSRTGPPAEVNYGFYRSPFLSDTHSLGPISGTDFLMWLHPEKGCGDFVLVGTPSFDSGPRSAPFSIPCTDLLIPNTISPTFTPGPGSWAEPELPGSGTWSQPEDPWTLWGGPSSFSVEVTNKTATQMEMGFDIPEGWIDPPSGPGAIPPGGFSLFEFTADPPWTIGAQGARMASAQAPRITATLVFSLGPTARISKTIAFARPERVYTPLVTRGWTGGW